MANVGSLLGGQPDSPNIDQYVDHFNPKVLHVFVLDFFFFNFLPVLVSFLLVLASLLFNLIHFFYLMYYQDDNAEHDKVSYPPIVIDIVRFLGKKRKTNF